MAKSSKGSVAKGRGKNGFNRSQAIRDVLAKNKSATTKQITAELAEQNVNVSAGLIGLVRRKYLGNGHKKAVVSTSTPTASSNGDSIQLNMKQFKLVAKLVREIGSAGGVRDMLDVYEAAND